MRHRALMAVCLLSGMVLTTACSKEEEGGYPASSGQIAVFTSVSGSGKADGTQGEEVKACLLFWQKSDYDKILNSDFAAYPFLVCKPEEKIDYYNVNSGVPYNTLQSYPIGNRTLHVCGFAPDVLTHSNFYKTLAIPPELQNGKTDFLSGDGNNQRVGSSTEPFVVENKDYVNANAPRQLAFCHLTSKIVITAKRSAQMLGRIGVRNIKVTLYDQKVPTKLEWRQLDKDNNCNGYIPVESVYIREGIRLKSETNDPLVQTLEQKVDSCYVLAGNQEHCHPSATTGAPESVNGTINMTMDITADLIPVVNGAYDYDQIRTETWSQQTVRINSQTGDMLKMGYKYAINITFDISGIRLQGIEMEWEDGGTHYIPITPKPKPDKEETKP